MGAIYPESRRADTKDGPAAVVAEGALVLSGSSSIAGKGVRIAFDGGRLTSDAGVLLLADIERRLGIAERLARCLTDPRSPERVRHTLAEMIRFRVLLIAAGYADANDCDALRADPAFKMAVGRAPESGRTLCSQPTMCRLENLPTITALKRMMAAMVELFCDSFENLVKAHKVHLASDRTSCTKATANQFRLVLHTAAYWLLHTLRGLAPRRSFWREAQFDTVRFALVKVVGRVTELASRIELALPSDYRYRDSLTLLAARAARPP